MTFRHAVTFSRNIITVKILQDIGVRYVVDYAKKLGVSSPLDPNLSLALGASGVSLLELTTAYAVFANQGAKAEPLLITRIVDRTGKVLEENKPLLTEAISPQTAYLITNLLQSVVEEGTGRSVKALGRPCAAKTGTTNDMRDAWFIGYTPDLLAGTWVGFDIEKPLGKKETGAVAASPIWLRFMQEVFEGTPKKVFRIPEGIVFRQIDLGETHEVLKAADLKFIVFGADVFYAINLNILYRWYILIKALLPRGLYLSPGERGKPGLQPRRASTPRSQSRTSRTSSAETAWTIG